MAQQLLTKSQARTKQRIAARATRPASAQSSQRRSHPILQLQRRLGNRRVMQLIQARRLTPEGKVIDFQRKLSVGAADDHYEQEADRVARQVMNIPDAVVPNAMQRDTSSEKDQTLQTKPLAASITAFVERQSMPDEESEHKPVEARFSAEASREPLQRQHEADEEEAKPIQAKSGRSLSDSFEAGADVETRVSQSEGRGSPLPDPVRAYLEPRFGVDFSQVRVHTGSDAIQMNRDLGARAFTHGSDIYFGEGHGPGNLELSAHELTHVVQQTGPVVQDERSVRQPGDLYERGVRRGSHATQRKVIQKVIQRAPVNTHFGEFKDEYFADIKQDGTAIGADLFLKFTPNDKVDATKVALTQSVKNYVEGNPIAVDVTKEAQQVKSGTAKGYYVDQLSEYRNPLYATSGEPGSDKDKLESYATPSPVRELTQAEKDANTAAKLTGPKYDGWGEHGYRKKIGADWKTKAAELHDAPTLPTRKANSGKVFETAAVAIDGTQKGTYYGSVSWGLKTDAAGKLSKVDMAKASDAVPTQNFMAAAKLWNASSARGTLVTKADDTKVYDASLSEKFKLKKDVKLDQKSKSLANDIVYLFVEVDASEPTHGGKTGYVKMSDVKDKGDGKSNVKLPYIDVKLTNAVTKLYKAKDKKDLLVELPKDTRLRVNKTEGDLLEIEVVHGANAAATGWIDKGQIKDEA